MPEALKIVLIKMCSYVGADFLEIDFKSRDWFVKYSWAVEQQANFSEWLEKECYFNWSKYKRLAKFTIKSKTRIKLLVNDFLFCYGWKQEVKEIE